jgi:hypothetical protein
VRFKVNRADAKMQVATFFGRNRASLVTLPDGSLWVMKEGGQVEVEYGRLCKAKEIGVSVPRAQLDLTIGVPRLLTEWLGERSLARANADTWHILGDSVRRLHDHWPTQSTDATVAKDLSLLPAVAKDAYDETTKNLSSFAREPVWNHGDLQLGNVFEVTQGRRLFPVLIDFEDMCLDQREADAGRLLWSLWANNGDLALVNRFIEGYRMRSRLPLEADAVPLWAVRQHCAWILFLLERSAPRSIIDRAIRAIGTLREDSRQWRFG